MANMKDQIVNYLSAQGLQPSIEEFGIFFKYQMMNFWILTYDNDEQYFRLIMPGIMDVDQNNRADVLEACNKVCNNMKVAKCYISENEDVWLACEQLLDSDPRFDDIIPRSLKILLGAFEEFRKAINS